MPELTPFHLAIPVRDLAAARAFYGELLGCRDDVGHLRTTGRAPRAPHHDDDRLAPPVREVELVTRQVLADELDGGVPLGDGSLHDLALTGDVALVAGSVHAPAARQGQQPCEQGQQRPGHGRVSSGAPPAEKGAFLSRLGIRSPAGSE